MSVDLTEREIVGLLIDSFGHKGVGSPLTYEQGKDGIDITKPTYQVVNFVRAIEARRAATSPAGDLVERLEDEAYWLSKNSLYGDETKSVALLREAATVIQTLQRERDALREALRPFAERAVGYEHLPAFETDARFQHLRRARLLLKEGGE